MGGDVDRGYGHYGGDRSLQIVVTGKDFGPNHPYVARSLPPPPQFYSRYDLDLDRRGGKGTGGGGGGGGSAWCFSDPEMKRRKRVASYKAYSAEGKLKSKVKRGWSWIKSRCRELVNGYD